MGIEQSHEFVTRMVPPSLQTDDPGANQESEVAACSVVVGADDGKDGLAIHPTLPNFQPPTRDSPPLDEPPIRVMALHALLYCERLFYLEEVEEIRVADHAVYAGRRLHDDVLSLDDETPERRSVEVSSENWGIFGKVDAVRRRDGTWVAYEHKRGRCRRGDRKEILPWPSDRIQAVAYAVLLAEDLSESVPQVRIRYHADNVTALVDVDDQARAELRDAIERARQLRRTTDRPPVAENENLCPRCSLAPVCLPEEERLVRTGSETTEAVGDASDDSSSDVLERPVPRLFPANRQRQTLHITQPRARIGRSAETLVVTTDEGKEAFPIHQIDSVSIHGYGQISTQAIQLCAYHGVAVQWLSAGGKFIAGTTASPGRVQQRLRQYEALADSTRRLELARRLVHAKIETQLRYILRATRSQPDRRDAVATDIERCREALRKLEQATRPETLLGLEGIAAKSYKHPHTGQSLEYARIVELEVRLLEKEWTGCPGLFAQLRMR